MEWDAEEIRLFVDDKLLNHQNISAADGQGHVNPWREFQVYMIVSMAIGGDNGGDPSNTDFPLHMLVDYISFYERKSGNSLVVI